MDHYDRCPHGSPNGRPRRRRLGCRRLPAEVTTSTIIPPPPSTRKKAPCAQPSKPQAPARKTGAVPKTLPIRKSLRQKREDAIVGYTSLTARMPIGGFFVSSSQKTLAVEKLAFSRSMPSMKPMPPLGNMAPLTEGDGFKKPQSAIMPRAQGKLRRYQSEGGSDSETSTKGQAPLSKIGGQYTLMGDPLKWKIRESMKYGKAWTAPALQKHTSLDFSEAGGRVIGGTTKKED